MVRTENRGDYLTSRDWFADVLQGMDVILRGASALEHLQMFNGYLNESEIEVYALADTGYENINHHIVGSFDNIEWVEIAGVKCCTFSQTVKDMIDDWGTCDAQALTEALAEYYYFHGNSFTGLPETSNPELLSELKEWALQYYRDGYDFPATNIVLLSIRDVSLKLGKEDENLLYGQFLDDFYYADTPEKKYSLLKDAPLFVPKYDIFLSVLAATAEKLANDLCLNVPEWVHDDKYILKEAYYAFNTQNPEFREYLINTTPAEYAKRNLFVGETMLERC